MIVLLEPGPDVNAQHTERDTPLHFAASRVRAQETVEAVVLLRAGADETILNDEGKAVVDVVGGDLEED